MQRRDFLKTLGAIGISESLARPYIKLADPNDADFLNNISITVMQGLTTATTTQLSVVLPKDSDVLYFLKDIENQLELIPSWGKSKTNSKSNHRADQMEFTHLKLGHRYEFNIIDRITNQIIDQRFLKTVDLEKTNPKIAVMSCMNDLPPSRIDMWNSALAVDVDYYFFIGDVIYGDNIISHGPDKLWSRFVDSRARIPFYSWKNLKPVLALWDDHDFGKNNAGGDYIHKNTNLETFKSFLAQEASPNQTALVSGPANSQFFKAFGQNFFFFDNRYYRKLIEDNNPAFLGRLQIDWAQNMMNLNSGQPTWLMQGSPYFGRTEKGETSYQSTALNEWQQFTAAVSKWNTRAIFVGGDLHYSEISEVPASLLGYKSYEFISSAMHSLPRTSFYDNPNRKVQGTLLDNFMLFEKDSETSAPAWKVSAIGKNNTAIFQWQYALD